MGAKGKYGLIGVKRRIKGTEGVKMEFKRVKEGIEL